MQRGRALVLGVTVSLGFAGSARADDQPPPPATTPPAAQPSSAPAPPPSESTRVFETVVTATSPLHGSGLPLDHVPANVQVMSGADVEAHQKLDLSSFLGEVATSVHINDVQNNPLQPDFQYRGFLASPLLGAPQGLSMYLDGVRLNEPFGDTINWDLIPANAIRSVEIMPGSNPIFGLNTLGGALSMETKTGFSDPGAEGSLLYGSWGRKLARVNVGAHGDSFGVFAAAQIFDEDGWRQLSPTRAQQALVSAAYESGASRAELVLMGANTSLTGNGPAPEQLLAMNRAAVFTVPDRTENQSFLAILRGDRPLAPLLHLSGNAYFRLNRTKSLNGDQHDWAECAATPGVLCSQDDSGTEAPVLDEAGNPVPFDTSYDAADNRTDTRQTSYGVAGQLTVTRPVFEHESDFFVGFDVGQSRVRFRSQTTVASLDDDRATVDAGFLDPTSPIAVDSVADNLGVYASETLTLLPHLYLSGSVRFNLTSLALEDQIGDDLTGDHRYHHVNPAAGVSYQPRPWLGAYFGFSESNRAPTAIELTCASPDDPCRLPNAFVSDPELAQVVARTFEAGVRGTYRRNQLKLGYSAAAFQTTNTNDIIFISSGMVANQGYFANVGDTRRRGIEAQVTGRQRFGARARLEWSVGYTYLDATFQSAFIALSETHPDAVNGSINVPAGSHIPSIPKHMGKAGVTYVAPFGLSAGVNVVADSGQYFRGDEANLLPQIPGYVVVNARVAYEIVRQVSVFALADNIFNEKYSTFGVLGDATDVLGASFDSPRFLGPGAPRAGWVGLDLRY